jgi:hypothetical protein
MEAASGVAEAQRWDNSAPNAHAEQEWIESRSIHRWDRGAGKPLIEDADTRHVIIRGRTTGLGIAPPFTNDLKNIITGHPYIDGWDI